MLGKDSLIGLLPTVEDENLGRFYDGKGSLDNGGAESKG